MASYDPLTFQMTVLAHALDFYLRTGMKVNRAYAPQRMMATAARLTQRTFKPREYGEAAAALLECARKRNEEARAFEATRKFA